jgi:hypothetical protein
LVARLAKLQRYPTQARGVQGVASVAFSYYHPHYRRGNRLTALRSLAFSGQGN